MLARRKWSNAFGVAAMLIASSGLGLHSREMWGQDVLHASDPLPAFEVATIKPPDPKGMFVMYPPGAQQTMRLAGVARFLVARAFNLQASAQTRVLGGPGWVDTQPFHIEGQLSVDLFAKMQPMHGAEREQIADLLLQSLLAERFKLKVHFEKRELPVYELIAAKDGPRMDALKPVDTANAGMSWGKGAVRAGGKLQDVFQMAPFGLGGRPIVNKTGLDGSYRINLKWWPPHMPGQTNAPAPEEETSESIFTVLQEQLGLKLVPGKAQLEVVVIDSIEQPTEN